MKRILSLILLLLALTATNAQETITTITLPSETPDTHRVYAELVGYGTNVLRMNKNVNVTIDLGQFQSANKDYSLLDENGKTIKFNSMVAAMNYMGERGWKFVQAYVVRDETNLPTFHWLMYKDITDPKSKKSDTN